MFRSIFILSAVLTATLLAQGSVSAAEKECMVMGDKKSVTEGTSCPMNLYDTLSALRFEKEVMRDGKKVTEVDTFTTFLQLADAAGFTAWLKGAKTPPKVHGDSIHEKAMTIFVPTDKSLESMKADLMSDEKILKVFVANHILPLPKTKAMMINKFADVRATILYPKSKRLDIFWLHGARVANGSADASRMTSQDHIASNGVVHVLDRPIGM